MRPPSGPKGTVIGSTKKTGGRNAGGCGVEPSLQRRHSWQVAVERRVSKRRYGSLGVEPEVKVEEGMGPGKLESDNRDHL